MKLKVAMDWDFDMYTMLKARGLHAENWNETQMTHLHIYLLFCLLWQTEMVNNAIYFTDIWQKINKYLDAEQLYNTATTCIFICWFVHKYLLDQQM